jgi:hypothetical protein
MIILIKSSVWTTPKPLGIDFKRFTRAPLWSRSRILISCWLNSDKFDGRREGSHRDVLKGSAMEKSQAMACWSPISCKIWMVHINIMYTCRIHDSVLHWICCAYKYYVNLCWTEYVVNPVVSVISDNYVEFQILQYCAMFRGIMKVLPVWIWDNL